jgi:hypothetical protein
MDEIVKLVCFVVSIDFRGKVTVKALLIEHSEK